MPVDVDLYVETRTACTRSSAGADRATGSYMPGVRTPMTDHTDVSVERTASRALEHRMLPVIGT